MFRHFLRQLPLGQSPAEVSLQKILGVHLLMIICLFNLLPSLPLFEFLFIYVLFV